MPQREKNILSVCDEGDQPPPLHPLAHRHSGPPPRHQRHFTAESNTSEDHETVPSYRAHVESSRRCDVGNPQASTDDDDDDREWDSEQDEGEDGILFSVFQSVSGRAAETLLVSSSTTAAEASGVDSDAYSTHVIDCGLTDMFQKVEASKVEAETHHMLFDSLSEASTVSLERQQGVYHEELESQLRNLIQEMFEGIESPSRVREAAQLLDREGVVEYNVYRPPRGAHLQPRLSAMHLVEWGEARADRCSLFVTGSSVCPPQAPSPSGQSSRANSGHLVMKPPIHHHHHHHHHSHRSASDLSIVGIPLRYPSALLQNATEESPFGGRVEEVLEIDGEVEEEEIFAMHADDDEPAVVDRREVPHQQRFVTDAQRLARGFPAVSPETVLEEDAREAEVIRVWETVCIPAIRERWDHLRRVAVVRGGALTKSLTAYIPIMSALLGEDLEPRDCRAPCTPPPAPGGRSRQSRLQRAKEKTPKQTKSGGRPVAHPPTGKDDPPTRQRKVSSQVNRFSCYMEPLPGREQGGKGGPENRSRSLDGAKERSRTQSPPPVVSTDSASLPVGVEVSNGKQPELGDGNVTSGALPGIPSRRRQTPTVRVMPSLNEAPPPMRGSGALALLLNRAQTALVRSTPHQPSRRL